MLFRRIVLGLTLIGAASQPALALDKLKLAIGQRGLWDSSIAEAGDKLGIFKKHGLEMQVFYTSSGGETLQVVISGCADIGISAGTLGVLGAYSKGAPLRIIGGEATGTAEYYFVRAEFPIKKWSGRHRRQHARLFDQRLGHAHHGAALHEGAELSSRSWSRPAPCRRPSPGDVRAGRYRLLDAAVRARARKARARSASSRSPTISTASAPRPCAPSSPTPPTSPKRPDVYKRFVQAYREAIDWMYTDDPKVFDDVRRIRQDHAGDGADRARQVLSEGDAADRRDQGPRRA